MSDGAPETKKAGEEKAPPPASPPAPVTVRTPAMKRRRAWRIGGIAALVAFPVLVYILHDVFTHESTDDAFIDAHVSDISARVEGQVTRVAVDDNQLVHQGDLLVEIDPPDFAARLDQARARLLSSQATSRRADLDLARYAKLVRTDDVTRQQVDVAKAEADSARADVLLQQALVKEAELNLSYTRIIAPDSGRVTHKSVAVGDYLKVGSPILSIVPDRIWVTANFKETQLTHMKPGQPAKLKVDAYPGKTFDGHVDSIQSGTGAQFSLLPPENATGNYVKVVERIPVKILIDTVDPSRPLAPGMSVVPSVKVR